MLPAVSLGLLAAFLFAASASLQQHSAHVAKQSLGSSPAHGRVRSSVAPLPALARRLVRSRLWLVGWATNLVGFLTQAAALHFGSVALVQPLLVTQLLFALPMATAWSRRRPSRLAWMSAAAISGGVAIFLAVRGPPRLVAPRTGNTSSSAAFPRSRSWACWCWPRPDGASWCRRRCWR
ncbi:hypothetical protein Psuf_090610 [Phytohabitans suffuscus]|uniref:EamA domain-containing protein n=1 Tax=Phytohabitans suffuscus TaxID=624315 RepID=A0A6F8Z0N4_9ACTN|nr:DMT family transporter [Phytohabitans suffuscus]BCB91748.1 hypothetical protein Psuf_090610 [Phytohabitans suffuscus]